MDQDFAATWRMWQDSKKDPVAIRQQHLRVCVNVACTQHELSKIFCATAAAPFDAIRKVALKKMIELVNTPVDAAKVHALIRKQRRTRHIAFEQKALERLGHFIESYSGY